MYRRSFCLTRIAYIGDDYPQEWDIPTLDPVLMSVENSVHYAFNTSLSVLEWEAILPSNGGVLYLGDRDQPQRSTISMFHQLRCLNIIRDGLVSFRGTDKTAPSRLVTHCMQYLRQMVLCRSHLHLESVRNHVGPRIAVSETTHRCRDWSAVYEAAESNIRQNSEHNH